MDLYLSQQETEDDCQKILGLWNENVPKEEHIFKGPPRHEEGNMPERVVMILIMIGDHMGIEDPLKEGDIKVRMEGHQIEEGTRIKDILGEGTPIEMGDPWKRRSP